MHDPKNTEVLDWFSWGLSAPLQTKLLVANPQGFFRAALLIEEVVDAQGKVLRGNKAGAMPRNGPILIELGATESVFSGQVYVYSSGNGSSSGSGKGAREMRTCHHFKKLGCFLLSFWKLAVNIEAHMLRVHPDQGARLRVPDAQYKGMTTPMESYLLMLDWELKRSRKM